jgi:prepilin-type N-terminal cleavage/methylation domain-containing protein
MVCRQNRAHHAFTLVELLVVIVVIAVLAGIAIPKFVNAGIRSKESTLRADLQLYRTAVSSYLNDTGAYPAALTDLTATSAPASGYDSSGNTKTITSTDWKGPYLASQQNDPVSGNALTYSTTSPNVGKVTSSASGNASDGTAYSSW